MYSGCLIWYDVNLFLNGYATVHFTLKVVDGMCMCETYSGHVSIWGALFTFWVKLSLTNLYQGVMEQLDVDIVPYIVLLVVPVLGRMSDPSDSIRFMATQCFATLIRLLPLEVQPHK